MLKDLWDVFLAMITKLCQNARILTHQFKKYHQVKELNDKTTCMIIVDFSENYTCGHNKSIQSCHFGAFNTFIFAYGSIILQWFHYAILFYVGMNTTRSHSHMSMFSSYLMSYLNHLSLR